jgi:hypothetical protein
MGARDQKQTYQKANMAFFVLLFQLQPGLGGGDTHDLPRVNTPHVSAGEHCWIM